MKLVGFKYACGDVYVSHNAFGGYDGLKQLSVGDTTATIHVIAMEEQCAACVVVTVAKDAVEIAAETLARPGITVQECAASGLSFFLEGECTNCGQPFGEHLKVEKATKVQVTSTGEGDAPMRSLAEILDGIESQREETEHNDRLKLAFGLDDEEFEPPDDGRGDMSDVPMPHELAEDER